MKTLGMINLVLLTLLSIYSGIAKISLLPNEMEFFQGAGFTENILILYGAAQLLGGLLLIFRKTRLEGAIVMIATFAISTVIIFKAGNIGFGFISILPILMASAVIDKAVKKKGT